MNLKAVPSEALILHFGMLYVAFSGGNLHRNNRYFSLSASVLLDFGFAGCSWPHCSPGAAPVIAVSICPFLQQVWL